MLIRYTLNNCEVQHECDSVTQAFDWFQRVWEVFNYRQCGHCGKDTIFPSKRMVPSKDNPNKKVPIYSWKCASCQHELNFGNGDDGIYPKTYDKKVGAVLPNKGWVKYDRRDGFDESYQKPSGGQPRSNGQAEEPLPF